MLRHTLHTLQCTVLRHHVFLRGHHDIHRRDHHRIYRRAHHRIYRRAHHRTVHHTTSLRRTIHMDRIIGIDASLSINEVLDESKKKSHHQDVQPNISEINFSNTFFEHILLNDKTVDITDLNINFSINEVLDTSLNVSITEINNQNDKVAEINSPDVNNIQNNFLEFCEETTVNQQEDIYEDCEDYKNDPDYEVSNDSKNFSDESNTSIVSQSFNENEKSNITNSSLDTSKYTYEGKANCDDTNLIVHNSQKKGANKKYFCMYCKKLQTKFARHLETVRKNEAEVKKFILLPKGKYNNLYICISF
ncbi:uncharacterized protein DDB_G0281497-like [Linepithema humile]|uniref:uncharacterized protein DDB_G0281497-like n=1 Tax=Linepithema humile TaxID=83485 RepID=UPI00351ED7D6